MSVVAQMCGSS